MKLQLAPYSFAPYSFSEFECNPHLVPSRLPRLNGTSYCVTNAFVVEQSLLRCESDTCERIRTLTSIISPSRSFVRFYDTLFSASESRRNLFCEPKRQRHRFLCESRGECVSASIRCALAHRNRSNFIEARHIYGTYSSNSHMLLVFLRTRETDKHHCAAQKECWMDFIETKRDLKEKY